MFIVAFSIIGVLVFVFSQAATPSANIEPESGSVSGNARVGNDANASNSKYVTFGGSAGVVSGACTYSQAVTPAFCETFDSPYTGTKTQTGDLDPVLWGVSRRFVFGSPPYYDAITPSHNACSGGGTTGNVYTGDPNSTYFGPATPPPLDARICNGIYVSSNNDGGIDVSALDAYPKQPFNFANRTGTVVFDVTADSAGSHAAWPEFWITDEPIPGMVRCITTCPNTTHGENSIGFSLAGGQANSTDTGVDIISITKGGVYQDIPMTTYNTIKKGCLANHSYQCPKTQMNHIEVRVSTTRIDIYGTDGGSTTLKHMAGADIPGGLSFSQGLVWINDVHYNARKQNEPNATGTQYDHSFGWDNLGFDGPKTYRDLGYDVPMSMSSSGLNGHGEQMVNIGYPINNGSITWPLPNVTWSQTPTKAKIVFNVYSFDDPNTISVSLNGHTAVSKVVNGHPVGVNGNGPSNAFNVWTMAIDLPASDVVQGTNTLKMTATSGSTIVGNVSMILVAGAPVP